MASPEDFRVGVILERRPARTPWAAAVWTPLSVIPETEGHDGGHLLRDDGATALRHAGHATLALSPHEAGDYRLNIGSGQPRLWVVLRAAGTGAPAALRVTASSDTATAHAEGDDTVLPVPMPPFVEARLRRFLETCRPDAPIRRRRRSGPGTEEPGEAERTRRRDPVWRPGGEG